MNYEERLQHVSVIGAGGKMGSGILLLTALEMANLQLIPGNESKSYILAAIDVSPKALTSLYRYLKVQIQKIAEKKVVHLRNVYKHRNDLIENSEIIDQYVDDVLKIVQTSTRIESAYDSSIIFEAIIEDVDLKVDIITKILANSKDIPWFFTNTSSVPIHEINEKANLRGNILGYHFYNPPAVQKLVELIIADGTNSDMVIFANQFAKNLRKTVVPSNDQAGFIGNGFFMRDLLFGIKQAESLMNDLNISEAIYAVNKISQDFMIRPMGIFQLIDYVGLDVCQKILAVMQPRLNDPELSSDFIDKLINAGIKGGQNSDGSQKPGIFTYEKGQAVAVYSLGKRNYINISQVNDKAEKYLNMLPKSWKPWKGIIGSKAKDYILNQYFEELKEMDTNGAKLAKKYILNAKSIGLKLVEMKVANKEDDVNKVMLMGFFHAYGPINNYIS